MEHKIISVIKGSIAYEMEIEAGDTLISVNDREIEDVFDWRDLEQEEKLTLVIRKKDGEEWELDIEKDPFDEIGLVFESDLMSDYRRCSNACIFCFIDQMPKGMRETLYFKDDDSRLSFLQGNYITLTNMSKHDVERIIRYRLEPMNISVHATDPELRCRMLNNRFAGSVLSYIDDFFQAGLHMNMQIVLCKGYNDGEQLERTLTDIYRYLPVLQSVSVVPVGLTRYREGLCSLEAFTKADAKNVIDTIERWQKKAYTEHGLHFVHASDEFYLLAEMAFPEETRYDGFLQLENGVGMARLFMTEAKDRIEILKEKKRGLQKLLNLRKKKLRVSFATGFLAEPILREAAEAAWAELNVPKPLIYGIRNDFFGEKITVAGLITGKDLIEQLKGKDLGDLLVLPNVMFRSGEEVFLDDVTRSNVEAALNVPVAILKSDGGAFISVLSGEASEEDFDLTHGKYELPVNF